MGYDGVATTMQLQFSMTRAVNDWWWAVDNLRIFIPAEPSILTIDRSTGMAELTGGDVITATINSIDVFSANGILAPVGNVGLSSLGVDSIGPGINESWQLATASSNQFAEFFLDGSSTFTNSRTESLGRIYDCTTPETDQDLVFTYTTIFGDVITGDVVYINQPCDPAGENADFNMDGIVDGKDLLILQRGFLTGTTQAEGDADGNGVVNDADLAILQSQYGQAPPASSVASAVPEPSGLVLATIMLSAVGLGRRRVRPRAVRCGFNRYWLSGQVLLVGLLSFSTLSADAQIPPPTIDRDYGFGDDDPGAVHGGIVGQNDPLGQNRTARRRRAADDQPVDRSEGRWLGRIPQADLRDDLWSTGRRERELRNSPQP